MRSLLVSVIFLLFANFQLYAAESWYKPPVSVTWQWQLAGVVNERYNVDLYDIDLFDSSVALIQRLHASGKRVICYFSAGSYEHWRPDANEFLARDLGKTLSGWNDERWIDIRSEKVRSIMVKRLELAAKKGCDGVEPDNVDSYETKTGFSIQSIDQLAFNRFIARQAHQRGLSVGLKNDAEQVQSLVNDLDFALNEQCFALSECDPFKAFIKQGKPVLNAEYQASYVNTPQERETMCQQSLAMHFSTLILPIELNDSFRISCQH